MRLIWWLLGLIVFIVVVGFALLNSEAVKVNYYLGEKALPLVLLLAIAFLIGGILGWTWGYGKGRLIRRAKQKQLNQFITHNLTYRI
jgi:uncharacterized integral membrane protein